MFIVQTLNASNSETRAARANLTPDLDSLLQCKCEMRVGMRVPFKDVHPCSIW